MKHIFGVGAGQVDPAAAVDEQGVTGDQGILDAEALTARCMSGGV